MGSSSANPGRRASLVEAGMSARAWREGIRSPEGRGTGGEQPTIPSGASPRPHSSASSSRESEVTSATRAGPTGWRFADQGKSMSETSGVRGHRTVTDASIMRFGTLTGDYAQMHFDLDFGPANGMGGTIAHGLLSGACPGALAQHAPERLAIGERDAYGRFLSVRFSRMIYIGDLFAPLAGGGRARDGGAQRSGADRHRLRGRESAGEVATSGAVSVAKKARRCPRRPRPSRSGRGRADSAPLPIFAEDMVEFGPRGETRATLR